MESIAAFDAKTRRCELLDRAANGENFEITKYGRRVGKLGPRIPPVTPGSSRRRSRAAQERSRACGAMIRWPPA